MKTGRTIFVVGSLSIIAMGLGAAAWNGDSALLSEINNLAAAPAPAATSTSAAVPFDYTISRPQVAPIYVDSSYFEEQLVALPGFKKPG